MSSIDDYVITIREREYNSAFLYPLGALNV